MVASRTQIDLINSIDNAKEYTDYNGKALDDSEKTIFDNPLLKKTKPDGTTEDDLDKVRDTVALLANLKEAQAKLSEEKNSNKENLSSEGNKLLIALMNERRNKTVAYQLINTDENGKKRVDEMFKSYQNIQFRLVNKQLEAERKAAEAALSSISKRGEKQDKKIEEAEKEMDKHPVEEAEKYKTKVQAIVDALKDDLNPNATGRKILEEVVDVQRKIAEVIYKKDSNELNSLGSIIKTGVKAPYSDDCFTHPTYLSDGFPWRMRELFEQFDKDKLFTLIDNKFAADISKKMKKSFERVINSKVTPEGSSINFDFSKRDNEGHSMSTLLNMDIPGIEGYGDSGILIPPKLGESREWNLYVSDIFYFMNVLFPQDTPNLDFSSNNYALPFSDSANTLTTEHDVFWRGRNDNTLSGKTYRQLFPNSAFPRDGSFPNKKLRLSWGGVKGKSIPEFFWQVYNDPKATQLTHKKILDKEGNIFEVWENDISVYENELISWKLGSNAEIYFTSYADRVKDIMKGDITINGHNLTDDQKFPEPEVYWTDFVKVCGELLDEVFKTFHHFREEAEHSLYSVLKTNNLIVPFMFENTKSGVTIFDDSTGVKSIWDKMISKVCDGKIANAQEFRNKWTAELDKRIAINAQEIKKIRELKDIKDKIKKLEDGKIDQLKEQLRSIGKKITSTSTLDIITCQEALSMRSFYWLLQKLEDKTTLDTDLENYIDNLNTLETNRDGIMGTYSSWKVLDSDFNGRLTKWKEIDGKNLDEGAVRAHLQLIKKSLNDGKKNRGLSSEEEADLISITNYLKKDVELQEGNIRLAFNIDVDLPNGLVDKWKNYGDKKLFKKDGAKLKEIGDIVNGLPELDSFFANLKTYLTGKSGVPSFPADNVDDQDKLEYFFVLDPEYVIGAFVTYQIKNDGVIKTQVETDMETAKNPADTTKGLDKTVYGDGTKFTEDGVIRFAGEVRGGQAHSYSSSQNPIPHELSPSPSELSWWEQGYYAPIWGSVLVIGGAIIAYFKRDDISEWWNGPANEEGEDEEKKEED